MIALRQDQWQQVLQDFGTSPAFSTGRQYGMARSLGNIIGDVLDSDRFEPEEVVEISFEAFDEWDVTLTIAQAAGIVVEPS